MTRTYDFPDPPVVDWAAAEADVLARGIVLERRRGTAHPRFAEIVYPLDYGYVADTVGEDGEPVDVFVGSGPPRLVGAYRTVDRRRGDTELKLLWGLTADEVYLVHGFLTFAPALMTATLTLRDGLAALR
jgi:inorganic pyrophosphatase